MCGISCIVALDYQNAERERNNNRGSVSKELNASLEQVRHRGPDFKGQWISPDGRIGLCHCQSPNVRERVLKACP